MMGRDGSSSWLWMGGRSALRSVQPIHYRSRNREENFLFNPLVIPLINVRKNTISMNNNDFDHKETEGYCVVYVHFNQESKFSRSSLSKYSKIKKKKDSKPIITSLTDRIFNLNTKNSTIFANLWKIQISKKKSIYKKKYNFTRTLKGWKIFVRYEKKKKIK